MREVTGEEITIKELKNCYFGYNEDVSLTKIVETIECNGCRYTFNEDADIIIRYPIDIDSDFFADCSKITEEKIGNITVYEFINNWWCLDDFDLEDFIFYFAE